MDKHTNIDNMINWPSFYGQYIHTPITNAGINKMHACCPFHKEQNESFWFNIKNGLWKCETGCGEGNATTFLAKLEGISNGEAYKKLCEIAGVSKERTANGKPKYSLKEYALEKRLPIEYLASLGVKEGHDDYYGQFIEIPYKDEHGHIVARRKRLPKGSKKRFAWYKGAKLTLYGMWRMDEIKAARYIMLVEGESDTQTLWFLGISALGFPGATNFSKSMAEKLLDVPLIYLHVEPDEAGQVAKRRVCHELLEVGYKGIVKAWSCVVHHGCKDPSSIYLKEDTIAAEIIWRIVKAADAINLEQAALAEPKGLEGAPIKLHIPNGYEINGNGIYQINAKSGNLEEMPFCWTPMLITRIMPSDTGEVKFEIAYKRGKKWSKERYPRGMIASSRTIIKLADVGMDVNSENAGSIVKYLSALERENMDLIPHVTRITHYGWVDDKHFVPGAMENYYFDTDNGSPRRASVGEPHGDFDVWKAAMIPHRKRSLFRFIMAAAFSSPLLKVLKQRIFMVYNWGDSKGGKTAAMMAALSAWGDPDTMKMSFNATQVGIERVAGFYTDLPIGLNERQLAGSKQEFVERIVYMLSEGEGKTRGRKEGGTQEQTVWRSVILANGEETLAVGNTQTGVSTRALEIYGKPFDNEREASDMYTLVAKHHGHAGVAFIKHLIKADWQELEQILDAMRSELSKSLGCSQSHVSAVALVATADYLVDQWIWGQSDKDAKISAIAMGKEILDSLQSVDDTDVNEKAYRYIVDWVLSNKRQFTDNYHGQRYGRQDDDAEYMLIFPSILEQELKKLGFNYQKTMRWLTETNKIDTTMEPGRVRPVVRRRIGGSRVWLIRMHISNEVFISDGFVEVEIDELPF